MGRFPGHRGITEIMLKIEFSLSQTTNSRLFKTKKSLQTTISSLMKMVESSLNRWENTAGKGEITRYEQFLLLPAVFSKDLYSSHVKKQGLFGKGLTTTKSIIYNKIIPI